MFLIGLRRSGSFCYFCLAKARGIDGSLSSPPSGVADGAVSYTLDALCIDRLSGQSWPFLDFPLCEFSAGLCRFLLPSPLCACRSPLWLCTGCFSSLWFCLVARI